jgi:uncharacterized protein
MQPTHTLRRVAKIIRRVCEAERNTPSPLAVVFACFRSNDRIASAGATSGDISFTPVVSLLTNHDSPLGGTSIARNDKLFAACVLFAFTSWTVWCALMAFIGSPFDQPVLRAIVRFAAFVFPAYFWLWQCRPLDPDRFRIVTNSKQGLLVGIVVSFIWAIVHVSQQFQLPFTIHAWLNVIILSPVAEELLFRRVAIDYATTKTNATTSVVASAVLFALVHLPWWLLSGEKTGNEVVKSLMIMFVYGLVFGVLYLRTRSLWASLIPHSVNNLIALSINP